MWIPKTDISACDPPLEKLNRKLHARSLQSGSSRPGALGYRGWGPDALHIDVPHCPSGIVGSVLCARAVNTAPLRASKVPSREKTPLLSQGTFLPDAFIVFHLLVTSGEWSCP